MGRVAATAKLARRTAEPLNSLTARASPDATSALGALFRH